MDELTATAFADRTGETFTIEEHGVELVLTTVETTGPTSFALLFEGPTDTPVGQGTYTFCAPDDATSSIFIVPVGPGEQGRPTYEAVFNGPPP